MNVSGSIPEQFHMLRHVYRSDHFNPPAANVKSIHKTDRVDVVHNHLPLQCLPHNRSTHNWAKCDTFFVDTSTARLNHYRSNHSDTNKHFWTYENASVRDTSIWRYRDDLIANTNQAILAIHLN